jgi:predicted TIM-barrel fold metal-dependent hydrolase
MGALSMRKDYAVLQNGIDMHAHTAPALFRRPIDDMELAKYAKEYGMRGFVLKDHDSMTCGRAYYVKKNHPEIDVFGGVVLNRSVGGINPYVVQSAIHYGAKVIWMPSNHSKHHAEFYGIPDYPQLGRPKKQLKGKGVTVLDDSGELLPEALQILEIIAENDVVLATGHLSQPEIDKLLDAAVKKGVKRILVTHANWSLCKLPLEKQKFYIDKGAYLEYVAVSCVSPTFYEQTPKELASWIKSIGSEKLILSSDLGQYSGPPHPEGLRMLCASLLDEDVSDKDLVKMLSENPARIMGIS